MSDTSTSVNYNKLSSSARKQREQDKQVQKTATGIISTEFKENILDTTLFRDDTTLTITPESLRDILIALRDNPELLYNHLSSITGIDYSLYNCPTSWGEIRFGIVYNLFSYEKRSNFALRVVVPEGAEVPSVFDLWHTADWQEREIYDLLGVRFTGHPDLRRLFLYDDFEDEHPLRKDYPLRGKGERDRSWRHIQRQAKVEK